VSTGDELLNRLGIAKRADLEALLGDLKLDHRNYRDSTDGQLVDTISAELRSAAGNSLMNVMLRRKRHEFSYNSSERSR